MRILIGLVLGLLAATASAAEHYGAPLTMKNPLTLEAAVQQLGDRATANVLVESTVAKVCEQRGCWLALKSASSQLHVTFKDEAFFVPATLVGKTVLVEGKLTKEAAGYQLVANGLQVKT
ncbi:MAG TPA: DUF4920 domain-containing protein [Steroidobacteraceae bacterium]|jgi:hypothetical protein|nr:DUF4920 domain-containing protein [Steroidobacteraceae bacterium]